MKAVRLLRRLAMLLAVMVMGSLATSEAQEPVASVDPVDDQTGLGSGNGQEAVEDVFERIDQSFDEMVRTGRYEAHLETINRLSGDYRDRFEFTWRAARAYTIAGDIIYLKHMIANMKASGAESVDDLIRAEKKFTKDQEQAVYAMGDGAREWAALALEQEPERVEGHFFMAIGVSMYVMGVGVLDAIGEGLYGKFKRHTEATLRIDPAYSDAGALRSKGRSYYALPWPLRDLDRSMEMLEEAAEVCPVNPRTRLYLGDTCWKRDRVSDAAGHYRDCVRLAQPLPDGVISTYVMANAQMKLDAIASNPNP